MDLHLIDGTYELFRAFYGAPAASSPTGMEVGATRGFARSLLSLLRQDEVSHVGVAFDHVIESFRNELYAGYKTGEGIDPALWAQFPLVERMAQALGVVVWPMIEFEADDALASAAARFCDHAKVERVLLCSPDKDLAQCVRGGRVVLFDRMRRIVIDEPGVVDKWGVPPSAIPDYLALVGDSADGIPGVPRWGAKSTATVLAAYGRIEDIPDDETRWSVKVRGAKSLAESLREHRREAALYKRLATLRTDAPIAQSLEDLRWRGADEAALSALSDELGDPRLLDRVHRWRS